MIAALMMGCTDSGGQKDETGDSSSAEFDQTMSVADSLFSCMQFRDAYDMYLQLLNHPVTKADSEKSIPSGRAPLCTQLSDPVSTAK